MTERPTLLGFLRAVWNDWGARMSGIFAVPFTTLGTFLDQKYRQYVWIALAIVSLLTMMYFVWAHKRSLVIQLEARICPKIGIGIPDDILTIPTTNLSLSKWIQFTVSSKTDAPLVECEVWITQIERLVNIGELEELVEEPIRCQWSQENSLKITIPPKLSQRANIFVIYEATSDERPIPVPIPTVVPLKIRQLYT